MLCIPRRQSKFNDIHGRKIEYLFNRQKNSWLKLVSFKEEMPIELDLERNENDTRRSRLYTLRLGEISCH